MRDPAQLKRIHRVREVQLRLAEADEARARDKAASEADLHQRVAQLAANVAPSLSSAAGLSLGAAALYRERLQRSADATQQRMNQSAALAERAGEVTRAARQDRGAVEKLIERAEHEAVRKEMRALQDLPGVPRNRHDPC